MGKITDVACMSLLWLVTSLPIVTVGASTAAFFSFCLHQVYDTEGGVWKSYFTAFKKFFKKATVIWLIELAGIVFFIMDLHAAWELYCSVGIPGLVVLSLCACLCVIFACCTFYIYPTLAAYDFPLKKLLTNSFILSVGNLPVSVTLIVMFVLVCVATYYVSGLFFLWMGLFIFFASYFVSGVFRKYEQPEEEADETESEEDEP